MVSIRCTLLASSVLLASFQLQAQLFDVGLKGGVNLDDFRTSYSHESVVGGHAGLFLRVKPPILPGAQGEILLTSIGAQVSSDGYSAEVRTLALQVPLFAVFAFGPVELHGGGYYERYLSDGIADIAGVSDVEIDGSSISLNDLADDGFGLLVGAGLHLGRFYGGLRYNVGLDALGSGEYLSDVRSRQVQAYLGFGFVGTGE